MVTAKAPSLPPVFLCISPQDRRAAGGVNSCQRFLRVHNFDCVWRLENSRQAFINLCLGRLWKGFCSRKMRAVLGVTSA